MYERKKVNTLEGYEHVLSIYEIDKFGNVYGNEQKCLSTFDNKKGYQVVSLKEKDKRRWKKAYVHRLIALAFVSGRTEERNEVDHKDGNRSNNCFYNLKWVNHIENMANGNTALKMWGMNGKKCYVYDYLLNYIGVFDSLLDAEKEIGEQIKGINIRTKTYYILEKPDLSLILKINRKQRIQSVVITNINTMEKMYFCSNREARRFFDNKVNITQAIQKNWTVRGKYKVRNLNYKKIIGMLDL